MLIEVAGAAARVGAMDIVPVLTCVLELLGAVERLTGGHDLCARKAGPPVNVNPARNSVAGRRIDDVGVARAVRVLAACPVDIAPLRFVYYVGCRWVMELKPNVLGVAAAVVTGVEEATAPVAS